MAWIAVLGAALIAATTVLGYSVASLHDEAIRLRQQDLATLRLFCAAETQDRVTDARIAAALRLRLPDLLPVECP